MVGVFLVILCDIGNSTFNFFDTKKRRSKKIFLDQKLLKKYKDKTIYFISVNKSATKKLKKYYNNCIDINSMFEFNTKYKGMGIDRQVACVLYDHSIIIDCGSAITVDVMKNGKHKGGYIMPGLKAYEDSFKAISPKLDYGFNKDVDISILPQNTQDAISYSIKQNIVLSIKDIRKKYKDLNCIITGGDGETVQKYIKNSVYKKHLLFDSMKEIIDAYNSTAKG